MHPNFNAARVRTHDLQIMTFHVTESPALTTQPSVTCQITSSYNPQSFPSHHPHSNMCFGENMLKSHLTIMHNSVPL